MRDTTGGDLGKRRPGLTERQLLYIASVAALSSLLLLVAAMIEPDWLYRYWCLFLGNILLIGLALYQRRKWRRRRS
jgi:hypothetical protein